MTTAGVGGNPFAVAAVEEEVFPAPEVTVAPSVVVVTPSFLCDGDAGGFGDEAAPRARSDLRSRRGGIGCQGSPSLGSGAVLELNRGESTW